MQAQISTERADATQPVPMFAMQEWRLGLLNICHCSRPAKHSGVGRKLQAGLQSPKLSSALVHCVVLGDPWAGGGGT